jgi:hypothetical protein
MFEIQGYWYNASDVKTLEKTGVLPLRVAEPIRVGFRAELKMKKSVRLFERFEKAGKIYTPPGIKAEHKAKAATKYPAGTRWVTVHPNGPGTKGVPVLIKDGGDGTAHVIGGAGGRLNMLKLNNIKSKEEYKEKLAAKKEEEKRNKEEKKKAEAAKLRAMDKAGRKEYKKKKKEAKEMKAAQMEELRAQERKVKEDFKETILEVSGYGYDPFEKIENDFNEEIKDLKQQITEETDDPEILLAELRRMKKAKEKALKAQESAVIAQGKQKAKDFQRQLLQDEQLREAVESEIGSASAEDAIKKNRGGGLGFKKGYKEGAEKKVEDLYEIEEEKKEEFEKRMEEIADEKGPEEAERVRHAIKENKKINDLLDAGYEQVDVKDEIKDLDDKTETLKSFLQYQKEMEKIQKAKKQIKDIQLDLEGNTIEETIEEVKKIVYGDGLRLDEKPISQTMAEMLQSEAEKMKTERQSALNSGLIDDLEKNKRSSTKWIANGVYNGFNAISMELLDDTSLPRDVVDILGVGNAARLMAYQLHRGRPDEFDDLTEAIGLYHEEVNESVVGEAVEKGEALLDRAESIELEIANTADDLALMNELNEQRLKYIDEANRIMGQAMGQLEASSALSVAMSEKKFDDLEINLGNMSSEDAIYRMRTLGLSPEDYDISGEPSLGGAKIAQLKKSAMDKVLNDIDPMEVKLHNKIRNIKSGFADEDGWLPEGIADRPIESFQDPGKDVSLPAGHIDNQEIPNSPNTVEAMHRALGSVPEAAFAFRNFDDMGPKERTAIRKYWEENIYKGSSAEATATKEYATGKGQSRQSVWNSFMKESGGTDEGAYAAIRQDLIDNHSEEDMFGEKEVPSLAKVVPGDWDTYRNIPEAREHFQNIDSLQSDLDNGYVENEKAARAEIEKMKEGLPEKLTEIYQGKMKDHYYSNMSGVSAEEFDAASERQERSPWGEFVRMFGDSDKAMESVVDRVKGEYLEKFSKEYGRVTKKRLKTDVKKIRHDTDYVLGMLDKETRDSYMDRAERIMKEYQAKVGKDSTGKFTSGTRRDKAAELYLKDKEAESQQMDMFGGEDLKQNDGTETVHIGERAEKVLASMMPEVSANHQGDRYDIKPKTMSGKYVEQQRAVKMLEATKKMNLSFGTGKGKTAISLSGFTHLKGQGKVNRGLFAVPSVVQKQFGSQALAYLEPNKYRWSATPGMSQADRIKAYKNGKNDMVVMTHQSLRDDMVHLMGQKLGYDADATKKHFNELSREGRRDLLQGVLKENGIDFGLVTVDESHYEVDRKGKEDSTLSNVLSALGDGSEYLLRQSATPVKNDVSEAFSMLQKVDPERFNDRTEFMKRYGVDTEASKKSLQRLIDRYNYASPTETGVKTTQNEEKVSLTGSQKEAYDKVNDMYRRARTARNTGKADIEAMKYLSPNSFKGVPEEKHEEVAKRLQDSAGIIRREAQNRVIHGHDWKSNAKVQRTVDIIRGKVYKEGDKHGKQGDAKPGIVFAHNIQSVRNLRSALEAEGLRVGVIQGSLNGNEKDKIKNSFNPSGGGKREYDVMVMSDAGATGLNLQNAAYLVNYDIPDTDWVLKQRNGRANRYGALHDEIEYHNLISDTDYDKAQWDRVKRKEKLGNVFQDLVSPENWDDTGVSSRLAKVRQNRIDNGLKTA